MKDNYVKIIKAGKGFRAYEYFWHEHNYWDVAWKSGSYRLKSEAVNVGRAYAENHHLKFKEE